MFTNKQCENYRQSFLRRWRATRSSVKQPYCISKRKPARVSPPKVTFCVTCHNLELKIRWIENQMPVDGFEFVTVLRRLSEHYDAHGWDFADKKVTAKTKRRPAKKNEPAQVPTPTPQPEDVASVDIGEFFDFDRFEEDKVLRLSHSAQDADAKGEDEEIGEYLDFRGHIEEVCGKFDF
ncbi:hypothetical protein CC80DRAFT_501564 [Byssothecium circinans]|uniref:Uncharacterized protein n=1 Tax=Byssothecium circinans TaxID=147558 RepID=A0A6A5U7L7_9PLEO|nr:hypothetical protein CC80DRAFT_501564 [Byssothecium circinans]